MEGLWQMILRTLRSFLRMEIVGAVLLVTALPAPAAASEWEQAELNLWVEEPGGENLQVTTLGGYIDASGQPYLPLQTFFGFGAPLMLSDGEWVVHDGVVYFPVGSGIRSVPIVNIGGVPYVNALTVLAEAGLSPIYDTDTIAVTVW